MKTGAEMGGTQPQLEEAGRTLPGSWRRGLGPAHTSILGLQTWGQIDSYSEPAGRWHFVTVVPGD